MAGEVHVLGERNSLLGQFLGEIRDQEIQLDGMRFRRNIERIGEIMAYEISKTLNYQTASVTTSLGKAECSLLKSQPVLATILRAGLPLHQGLLNYFDKAENAFISAYRKHEGDEAHFEVEIEYLSSPPVDDKTVILCDPMLASGSSMVLAWKALLERGTPRDLHVAVVIASREGVQFAREQLPPDTTFWVAAVDPTMTSRKYIVPGLGDAGDLAYGAKE
ncbi:MAG: uracil phosphoribosyltransferase [Xanthomonadales bacterium]|nr:uracil phosphoribosyltransferase [Gammaproteobacteria bacterium]NNL94021.1 uracil phosphoribosyltransferase [Xanthomonadales bacterium]